MIFSVFKQFKLADIACSVAIFGDGYE